MLQLLEYWCDAVELEKPLTLNPSPGSRFAGFYVFTQRGGGGNVDGYLS